MLDLRFNGGGSLKEAIDVTGLFIDAGPVVRVRDSTAACATWSTRTAAWPGTGLSSS